jgi:hypothetical protein
VGSWGWLQWSGGGGGGDFSFFFFFGHKMKRFICREKRKVAETLGGKLGEEVPGAC